MEATLSNNSLVFSSVPKLIFIAHIDMGFGFDFDFDFDSDLYWWRWRTPDSLATTDSGCDYKANK